MHLQGDGARNVGGVPGNLAVALQRVHVAHIDAAAGRFDGANHDRAGASSVDVHVPVGAVHQMFSCDAVFMWRANEERTEITGIVRIRQGIAGVVPS